MWMSMILVTAGLLHWYFWLRFIRDTQLQRAAVRALTWTFIVVGLSIPAGTFLRHRLTDPWNQIAFIVPITWLAVLFFICSIRIIAGAAAGIIRLMGWIRRRPVRWEPERRLAVSRILAATALLAGGAGISYGVWEAMSGPPIRDVVVPMDRMPDAVRDFTIVQITDLHAATWTPDDSIRRLVERVNALNADVIVFTGDIADGHVVSLAAKLSPLLKLKARHGIYFVTGNHEYYSGADEWVPFLQNIGFRCLDSEGVMLGDAIYLAGIPDRTALRFPRYARPDPVKALAGRPVNVPAVLLAHQPRDADAVEAAGADLQLSGHTHGGQIWPFGAMVMIQQPYLAGLHRHGRMQIYVSRGAGTWGPPIRIGAPAEITRIILRPPDS